MKNKAFTLVELLVVIAVLSVIAILILTIFSRSLRGNNKAQILSAIKQNGQSVLENIDKTIRGADNVVCPTIIPPGTTASSDNMMVVSEGTYTRYRFIIPGTNTNGLIQKDNPIKQDVEGSDPPRQETDAEFVKRVCPPGSIMPNPVVLTDINPKTGVSVENGLFKRDKSAGFADQLKVKFDLSPGQDAPSSVRGQIDAVHFETTIQLR